MREHVFGNEPAGTQEDEKLGIERADGADRIAGRLLQQRRQAAEHVGGKRRNTSAAIRVMPMTSSTASAMVLVAARIATSRVDATLLPPMIRPTSTTGTGAPRMMLTPPT